MRYLFSKTVSHSDAYGMGMDFNLAAVGIKQVAYAGLITCVNLETGHEFISDLCPKTAIRLLKGRQPRTPVLFIKVCLLPSMLELCIETELRIRAYSDLQTTAP